MRRSLIVAALAFAALVPVVAIFAQADSPAKKALAELQGVWKLNAVERDDETHELADRPCYWVVKGDKIFYGGVELASIKTDPATTPSGLDLVFREAKEEREGIYELKDKTWKICVHWVPAGVKERPQDFSTKDKAAFRVLTFERAKENEAEVGKLGMGFVGVAIRKDDNGAIFVNDAFPGSPAKKAGLAKDDQLIQVAGTDVGDLLSTVRAIQRQRPGAELTIRLKRDEKERDVKIKVGLVPFHFLVN